MDLQNISQPPLEHEYFELFSFSRQLVVFSL